MEKGRILVVGDDNLLGSRLFGALENAGYTVAGVAPSSHEGVLQASNLHPDLVLIDAGVGGKMTAIEAAKQIRACFDIPALYLAAPADREALEEAGVPFPFGYITKPFSERDLNTAIDVALYNFKLEEKIKERERWLETTLKSVDDAVIATDIKGRITFMNPVAEKLTEWTEADSLGRDVSDVFHVIDEYTRRPRENPVAAVLVDGRTAGAGESAVLLARGGTEVPIENSAAPMLDEQENLTGVVLVFKDITARKLAEEALRKERDMAQKYLDIAGVIMVALNEWGEITLVNRRGLDILGYGEGELLGRNWFETCVPRSVREQRRESFERLVRGENAPAEHEENPVLTKSGEERLVSWHDTVIRNRAGEIVGTLSSGEDITQRRVAEREKQGLQAQLVQSQKMEAIGALAGGVAHDFNNLLTVIQGNSELALMKAGDNESLVKNIEQIVQAGERAVKLTGQLLLMSRRQPMEFADVSVNEAVRNLMRMLERLIGEDISVETDLAQDLWKARGDSGNIEQVILNLAVNARDAMPQGGTLTVRTHNVVLTEVDARGMPDAMTGEFVRLTVEDTGTGMDRETAERIFEPFFTTKEAGRGTGLGLSVVYGIVKQHEGWINVHSVPREGTRFDVYFPALLEAAGAEAIDKPAAQAARGKGERILLVEDENGVRDFAGLALRSSGYSVSEVASAEEALEVFAAKQGRFDLVFSDVVLSGKSGVSLAEEISALSPSTPVLLTSGYTDDKSQLVEIRRRNLPFLQKPYALGDLLVAVGDTISAGRQSGNCGDEADSCPEPTRDTRS
jgi:two-component system cell cycle sensor histidine kinase/response regulator CckA